MAMASQMVILGGVGPVVSLWGTLQHIAIPPPLG
jgi:hypothetical protein